MIRRLAAFALLAAGAAAQHPPPIAAPADPYSISAWGDEAMEPVMAALEATYTLQHPEMHFTHALHGTGTGMAGIITGTSDLAYMGRPVTVNETIGFEWVHRTKPFGVQIMWGPARVDAYSSDGRSPALAVLVSAANPVQAISMAQLAAILGCPQKGATASVTWAAAGATGAWSARPLHALVYDEQTGTGAFLQQTILGGGDCWNWDVVKEFADNARPARNKSPRTAHASSAADQIIAALRADTEAIAFVPLPANLTGLKALPILGAKGSALDMRESIIDGVYPLARPIYLYMDRPAGKPLPAKLDSFLQFILSSEGQQIINRQGSFLPLGPEIAAAQQAKLKQP